MSDQARGTPSKTHYDHDTVPCATNYCRLDGGVSLSHTKADSCPDRLASMVQELEPREYTGKSTMMLLKLLSNTSPASSESPQPLVTQTQNINSSPTRKSSAAENVEHHSMENESSSTSITLAKHTAGISPENAQSIYPPEACVFVAK